MFLSVPRRLLPIVACSALLCFILLLRTFGSKEPWRSLPLEKIGLGEVKGGGILIITPGAGDGYEVEEEGEGGTPSVEDEAPVKVGVGKTPTPFPPGQAKPVGSTYTKMLVIPRTKKENVKWIEKHFPPGGPVNSSIYIADDPSAPLHPPKNKGHEVMVYLTYIIDNYDDLADVNIFMHSHQIAWHNDELLGSNAATMIERLSAERVQREGFMNLRCHWNPGCPNWMHPGTVEVDINKQEEVELASSWSQLFPMDAIPTVLAQPCCAQFAVSRDRIRALPRSRYVFYRDWLLQTPLSDYISGRIWEYVWHYLFTGRNVLCPKEHVCYCDGFGVCFGGEAEYEGYYEKVHEMEHLQGRLKEWQQSAHKIEEMERIGKIDEAAALKVPKFGEDKELEDKIRELEDWIKKTKEEAFKRGEVAMNRAKEVGRPWKDGDGF